MPPKLELPESLREEVRAGVDQFFVRAASRTATHPDIGRILTSHLLLQYQLNEHIEALNPNLGRVSGLSRLLPVKTLLLLAAGPPERRNRIIEVVGPGIEEINNLRNRLAHRIDSAITKDHLPQLYTALQHAYPDREIEKKSPAEAVSYFTAFACMAMVIWQTMSSYLGRVKADIARAREEQAKETEALLRRLLELSGPSPQDPESDPSKADTDKPP